MRKITEEMLAPEVLKSEFEGHRVRAAILPRFGANLSSLEIDGTHLLYFDRNKEKMMRGEQSGCFVMFPTPCRIPGCRYTFQGKEIVQRKRGEEIFIHGLVRDEEFSVKREKDTLTCSLAIDKNHPVFEGYPFPSRLVLSYKLLRSGIEIGVRFENTGKTDAPFGFGIHPFWRIPGKREDVFIKVPCCYVLEMVDLIPTGKVRKVDNSIYDLREYRSLGELDMDDVFWGRIPAEEGGVEYRDLRLRVRIDASKIFTHMIAYTPKQNPFACVEYLTCGPNAANLYAAGKKEVSGLLVVPPGGKVVGWIRYWLEKI